MEKDSGEPVSERVNYLIYKVSLLLTDSQFPCEREGGKCLLRVYLLNEEFTGIVG